MRSTPRRTTRLSAVSTRCRRQETPFCAPRLRNKKTVCRPAVHLHSRAVLRCQGEDGVRFSRLVMPPVAPSFPPCRKRWGRKGALVTVWCVLRLRFRQVLIFGYYEHTYSPYECYGTRRLLRDTRFVSRCVKIAAVNQLCVQILQDSTDSPQIPKAGGDMLQGSECSGIYGIRIPSGPSGQLPCQCCKTKSSVDKCRCIL